MNPKLGRPSGAKNKPKFITVKLADLNKTFSPETQIQVSNAYAPLFTAIELNHETSTDQESKGVKINLLN